jgi:serine/threonine-protein kinase
MAEPETPKLSNLDFLVSSVLSAGETGTVMLITAKHGGGRYALRVIKREEPKDDVTIERARAECVASAKVSHASILKVHDFRLRRSWFRVVRSESLMEYVDGKALSTIEGMPVGPATLIFHKVASALAHMHRRGVQHGDLKPSRILLSRTGQVKVCGYGISQVSDPIRAQISTGGAYSAPERVKGKVLDERTEVYGLAATMYHVMTGRPPAADRSEGRKVAMPSALNVAIPAAVNNLLVTCLQSQPDRRPADIYEVVTKLDAIVKDQGLEDSALAGIAV